LKNEGLMEKSRIIVEKIMKIFRKIKKKFERTEETKLSKSIEHIVTHQVV
jgi:hypothetical protein